MDVQYKFQPYCSQSLSDEQAVGAIVGVEVGECVALGGNGVGAGVGALPGSPMADVGADDVGVAVGASDDGANVGDGGGATVVGESVVGATVDESVVGAAVVGTIAGLDVVDACPKQTGRQSTWPAPTSFILKYTL